MQCVSVSEAEALLSWRKEVRPQAKKLPLVEDTGRRLQASEFEPGKKYLWPAWFAKLTEDTTVQYWDGECDHNGDPLMKQRVIEKDTRIRINAVSHRGEFGVTDSLLMQTGYVIRVPFSRLHSFSRYI